MDKIEPKVVQAVLDKIKELETGINEAGDASRAKLKDIKVDDVRRALPVAGNGDVNEAGWSSKSANEQAKLLQRLEQVRDSLQLATGLDGPTDPKHIMYGAYASNAAIVWSAAVGFALTLFLLVVVVSYWEQATRTDFTAKMETAIKDMGKLDEAAAKDKDASDGLVQAQRALSTEKDPGSRKKYEQDLRAREEEAAARHQEREAAKTRANETAVEAVRLVARGGASEAIILAMVILLGALGGTLHLLGSLVKYVGNRQLKRSWLLYYLWTPLAGAALAPILYMLLRVGLLSPAGGSTGSGSTVANLNLIAIYAFAALTGLFAKTATDKLAEIFKTAFRSAEAESKDAIGSEAPPGAPASPPKP